MRSTLLHARKSGSSAGMVKTMQAELAVPLVLGVAAVLQAALNQQIAAHTGLAAATALNMLVAVVCAVGFALFCALRGEASGLLRWSPDAAAFRLWWLVPGLVGFLIVLGLPWAVQRTGALSTFVALVAAQMLASALWDRFVGGVPLSTPRLCGALCTVAGVLLAGRSDVP
jgi:uncharacterized membrane protein YdcZ (DUF606 family)